MNVRQTTYIIAAIAVMLCCYSCLDKKAPEELRYNHTTKERAREVRDSINLQTERHYTDIIPERDKGVSTELGGIIFSSQAMGLNLNASCAGSSCHMPTNNLGPIAKMQGGEGVLFTNDGFVECKYYPKDIGKDIAPINTPVARGIVFKKTALSKGQALKEEQPSSLFGATAHHIDFNNLNKHRVMQSYVTKAFDVINATEEHYIQAIMDYQESFEWNDTKYVQWLKGENEYKYIDETVVMLWDKGCMKCHKGEGGISDLKGKVVLNSTGKNATVDTVNTRTWFGGATMPAMFWNASYKTNSKAGEEKHFRQEGITFTDKELEQYRHFRDKCLN